MQSLYVVRLGYFIACVANDYLLGLAVLIASVPLTEGTIQPQPPSFEVLPAHLCFSGPRQLRPSSPLLNSLSVSVPEMYGLQCETSSPSSVVLRI